MIVYYKEKVIEKLKEAKKQIFNLCEEYKAKGINPDVYLEDVDKIDELIKKYEK